MLQYTSEKDGVVETRIERKITMEDDEDDDDDIDHDFVSDGSRPKDSSCISRDYLVLDSCLRRCCSVDACRRVFTCALSVALSSSALSK